jgi:nitrogen fixation protein NifZ
MIDAREPKYQWGQRVRAEIDLYNDGSHPEHAPDALLVPAGAAGEIVQTGMHVDSNTPVYMVEFAGVPHVVGCLEEEIAPETANAPSPARGPADVQEAQVPRTPGMAESGLDPVGE